MTLAEIHQPCDGAATPVAARGGLPASEGRARRRPGGEPSPRQSQGDDVRLVSGDPDKGRPLRRSHRVTYSPARLARLQRSLWHVPLVAGLAVSLSGCAVLPTVLGALSTTINAAQWLQARRQAGLPNGTASNQAPQPGASAKTQEEALKAAVEAAYRQGIRDAVQQLTQGLGRDPRWTWVAPVVQEVWIPPQVTNGMFIPGHREWVLIRPGQWQAQFGLPLGPGPEIQPTNAPGPVSATPR